MRALREAVRPDLDALQEHALYTRVRSAHELCTFMATHVFAVWDFMTLLKSLQRRLTCVSLPWTRPPHPRAARLINEIVLAEESDEVEPGCCMSHFELYLLAMEQLGVGTARIRGVHDAVAAGRALDDALAAHEVAHGIRRFVTRTCSVASTASDVQVAADFLFGREDPIPKMFRALHDNLGQDVAAPAFRLYLTRHVEVDTDQHGPAAEELLANLCGENGGLWHEATLAARQAIQARIALWDDLLDRLP